MTEIRTYGDGVQTMLPFWLVLRIKRLIFSTKCAELRGKEPSHASAMTHTHKMDTPFDACWTNLVHAERIGWQSACSHHDAVDPRTKVCVYCNFERHQSQIIAKIPFHLKEPINEDGNWWLAEDWEDDKWDDGERLLGKNVPRVVC